MERCNTHSTIYDFVKDLDFPREVFEALNDNYLRDNHDYNLDVIYSSREEAEAYYSSDRVQNELKRLNIHFFKGKLKIYVKSVDGTAHEKWIARKNETEWGFSDATRSHIKIPNMYGTYSYSDEFTGHPAQYGFTEYIKEFNIPKSVVEDIVENLFGKLDFTIDVDRLYSELDSETLFKTADGKNIDPYVVDEQFIVKKETTNAPVTMSPPPETTTSISTETTQPPIGGSRSCIHTSFGEYVDYDMSYHAIDGTLIRYVGEEQYETWSKERKAEQGVERNRKRCNTHGTIYDFVKDFDFPREVFEALNDNYLRGGYDYNLDVIYASREETEAYYTSDRTQKTIKKWDVNTLKGRLKSYVNSIDDTANEKWIARKNETEWGFSDATRSHIKITNMYGTYSYSDEFTGHIAQYGFAEYIKEFNIPKSVVEDIVKDVFVARDFTIDVDRLYSELDSETLFKTADGKNIDPYVVDEQFIVKK